MLVEIKDLKFTYPDGHLAVDNLNLTIDSGESVALVGANGAGKSTLFNLMIGISTPGEGTITIADTPLTKKSLKTIREKVGMVFQNPDNQLFMTKVYDDVAFGPRNAMLSPEEVEARVTQALSCLDILALRDRMPHRLSGGEKRMVSVASVLAMAPEIILFDEPSSFLDPRARRNLITTLKQLPITKFIATHDLDMALELCERVIILKDGKIFADGQTETLLLDKALLEQCCLELPFCYQRCQHCPDRGANTL